MFSWLQLFWFYELHYFCWNWTHHALHKLFGDFFRVEIPLLQQLMSILCSSFIFLQDSSDDSPVAFDRTKLWAVRQIHLFGYKVDLIVIVPLNCVIGVVTACQIWPELDRNVVRSNKWQHSLLKTLFDIQTSVHGGRCDERSAFLSTAADSLPDHELFREFVL